MASAAKDDKYDFDLFTIGGGTGGVRAARFASANYGTSIVSHSTLTLLVVYALQQSFQRIKHICRIKCRDMCTLFDC